MANLTPLIFHSLLATLALLASAFPEDPTAESLSEIDANQDSDIDPNKVPSLSQSDSRDTASGAEDFPDIDTDANGISDSAFQPKLIQVPGNGQKGSNATAQDVASSLKPMAPGTEKQLVPPTHHGDSGVPQVVSVSGLAAEKPTAKPQVKHEAHIGIQEMHPARVPISQPAKTPQAIDTAKQATAMQSAEVVKASPVDRMVKHFAQVLRTAEIVPLRAEIVKQADTANATQAGSATDIDTRAEVQSAAKEVSEQLSIAESAEAKARVLDRKAAEELANATVLAKWTAQEALNAGAAAAHSKADELLTRISKFEDQAERADVRSAALHSKAKLETDEASELMAVADRALNHAPKQPL